MLGRPLGASKRARYYRGAKASRKAQQARRAPLKLFGLVMKADPQRLLSTRQPGQRPMNSSGRANDRAAQRAKSSAVAAAGTRDTGTLPLWELVALAAQRYHAGRGSVPAAQVSRWDTAASRSDGTGQTPPAATSSAVGSAGPCQLVTAHSAEAAADQRERPGTWNGDSTVLTKYSETGTNTERPGKGRAFLHWKVMQTSAARKLVRETHNNLFCVINY